MALSKVEAFEFVWEADIIKALLESENIPAYVIDGGHIQLNWALSNAMGGVRVMVESQHLERAKEIVAAWRNGEFENALDELQTDAEYFDQDYQCSQCQSTDIELINNRWKTLAFFLFIGPAPAKSIGYRCRHCHHQEWFNE